MLAFKVVAGLFLFVCAVLFARYAYRGMIYVAESFSRRNWRQLVEDIIVTALTIIAVALVCGVIVWIAGL